VRNKPSSSKFNLSSSNSKPNRPLLSLPQPLVRLQGVPIRWDHHLKGEERPPDRPLKAPQLGRRHRG
jgi:hypothetical protein